jgi:hypothetical protein
MAGRDLADPRYPAGPGTGQPPASSCRDLWSIFDPDRPDFRPGRDGSMPPSGGFVPSLQTGIYRTEKPANSSHGPCPYVTGQKSRRRAIQTRVFQSIDASGTVGATDVFCVMERALKHKYNVGETVYFTASNVARPAASGTYEVIRLLPTDGDDCQYRIKSSTEAFERVAKESQLDIS